MLPSEIAAAAKAKALADLKAAEDMERAAEAFMRAAGELGINVDFVINATDKTVKIVEAKQTSPATSASTTASGFRILPAPKKRGGKAVDPNSVTSRSKSESVKIIRALKRPVPLGELLDKLQAAGITLGGKNPNQQLSANLGNTPELVSTKRGWWLRDEPLPPEDIGNKIGGAELPWQN